MKLSIKLSVLTVVSILTATSMFAASVSTTNNNNVTASVVGSCKWTTPFLMTFGSYDPFAGTATIANATVQFKCIKNTAGSYKIWFSKSGGNLTNGAQNLTYSLTDTVSAALPTTAAAAVAITGAEGIGAEAGFTFTVNGSIAAGQDVAAGTYADTVVVTVEY
jgi:spore coat protein U-like protein